MKTKALLILSFCILITGAVNAQENEKRFGIELNGGASVATSKPGETQLNPGFGTQLVTCPFPTTSGQAVCTTTSKLRTLLPILLATPVTVWVFNLELALITIWGKIGA